MKALPILVTSVALLLVSCKTYEPSVVVSGEQSAVNSAFEQMLEDYYQDGLVLMPLNATFNGDHRYNHQFTNLISKEYRGWMQTHFELYLEKLKQFDDANLSSTEQMSKSLLQWECELGLEGLNFREDLRPIDQMWSVNLLIGQLASGASAQPFDTVEDYYNWLKRLDGYLDWMATAEQNMKEAITTGHVIPRSLVVKVLPQLEVLADDELETHFFFAPVSLFPESFTQEEKDAIAAAYSQMLTENIIPAYQSLHEFMSTEYLQAARASSGIDAIPDGDAYYAHQIKKYTTLELTADEVHELGLREVARIRGEMEKVMEEVGFAGELIDFFDFVRTNKDLMPYTTPEQVLENFEKIHDTMKPYLAESFDMTPKTAFEVRRTEAFREASASAEYMQGSMDGTRPGIFYVPIPDVTKYNIYGDEALFLHEAIPGHHYQVALTLENEDLPEFRKVAWNSAYGEGWGLYSESLGKELGLYTDPYQYFGMLGYEIHRAIRLVVDTGLHTKGWTREEAIQYSLENEAESEASIIAEIERYMANPGQALAYKIGQLKIRALRDKASTSMGDAFDVRQFHNQVLETGCIPLALLEEKIDRWIQDN
jgi:uncharacterized protein (DUF885 family)